ncbi:unnamed protein product [Linum tenue]|uniref:Uncharacterized protein n=1 Tax=Linum tenue TaxID=586396 RepID=A0AAV0H994_9ROSI|nr:unnamed protein product [Linum tenue]
MDEMAGGLRDSYVPFLLVARGERDRLQESCGGGEKGMVVPWRDQLKVTNSRQIVKKWRIGWRVKRMGVEDELVTRDEICEVVKRLMDGGQSEVTEFRERAQELGKIWRGAIVEGGSSDGNLLQTISAI